MPLRLDIQRKLSNRSARVKAVDFHPTEPWLLTALYTGHVHIWNYETQALVKTFEASELPLRACKFIPRKSWLLTGSDDMLVKVFNYNTHEKVVSFEAHVDYIRSVAVHASQPLVLTSSDDMTIKLWDWEKGWKNVMTFEGHTHFVMHVVFNPKDGNTFCSASMDRTLKVWSLSSPTANYTLEGHQKGVNCVEYYEGGDKPYLVSGADDKLIKVWDYQNKTCVQTLEGHTNNVMRVSYHPSLPILISGSEDGTVRIWHANTYRLENTLNYGMERVWCMACVPGSNDMAFGYDEGTISIKLGREEPSISMDNTGKIVWAKHNEIQTANIQQVELEGLQDGDKLVLPTKDLGNCEIYPQSLVHSPNGRFVVVCGDGEFIIYTALAWRNKSFGQALEFVWAQDSNEYAIRESTSKIKLFRSFKEKTNVSLRVPFSAEGIYGGNLLAVKSSTFVIFYDWETGVIVRRVDVAVTNIYWSETDCVCISSPDSFYVLKLNRGALQNHLEKGTPAGDEGYEDVLDFVGEVSESVSTAAWIGDCLIYTNSMNRLNYFVGGQTSTISHFDRPMYLLGFIPRDNRIYVCDKHLSVSSFSFPLCVIEYQTAILRGDLNTARGILPSIPNDQRNRIARFLETQDLKQEAMVVTSDAEHRFELAMQLNDLAVAFEIATALDHEHKWKILGDAALGMWNYGMALDCWKKANDLQSVLMLYQTSGNAAGLAELATLAAQKGENNVAFICNFLLSNHHDCIQLLIDTGRISEGAFYARTYAPSQVSRVVALWKQSLLKTGNVKAAESIADPSGYENLFADFKIGLDVENALLPFARTLAPAAAYSAFKAFDDVDIVQDLKDGKSLDAILAPLSGIPRSASPSRSPPKPHQSAVKDTPVRSASPVAKPAIPQAVAPASPPAKASSPVAKPAAAVASPPKPMPADPVAPAPKPTHAPPPVTAPIQQSVSNPPSRTVSPDRPPVTSMSASVTPARGVSAAPPSFLPQQAPYSPPKSVNPAAAPYQNGNHISPGKPHALPSAIASQQPAAAGGVFKGVPARGGPVVQIEAPPPNPQKPVSSAYGSSHNGGYLSSDFDMAETMSHLSMEVNTTGTGSVRDGGSVIDESNFDDFAMSEDGGNLDLNNVQLNDAELEDMLG